MRVDVKRILGEPGTSLTFDETGPVAAFDPRETDVVIEGPVTARGVATCTGKDVYVEGNARGRLSLVCSRCLSRFGTSFNLGFEARFVGDASELVEDDEDVEVAPLGDGFVELDDVIKREIILELPMKPLCKPDCAGLCPKCGKNLNLGPCDCGVSEEVTAFGRKLLDALKERGKENGGS